MSQSWNRMIASGFIPLIVIALIFGAYLGNVLSSPSADSLPSSSSVCNTYYDYDSSNPISVLVINSGSTGKICVKYTNSFNNSISLPSYIAVYEYNSSTNYPQLNPISYFQVSATPNSVIFTPSSSNPNYKTEIVTYTVSVPSSVTNGIYGIFLLQYCSLFPMVVAPSNNPLVQLSRSDFSSWYPHMGSCPAQEISAELIGVSGFRVVPAT